MGMTRCARKTRHGRCCRANASAPTSNERKEAGSITAGYTSVNDGVGKTFLSTSLVREAKEGRKPWVDVNGLVFPPTTRANRSKDKGEQCVGTFLRFFIARLGHIDWYCRSHMDNKLGQYHQEVW